MTSRFALAVVLCLLCHLTAASADVDFAGGGSRPSHRVKVKLFYETHCPYSRNFITKQLWPTYLKLSERLSVRLVPYGMARKKEAVDADGRKRTEITCQHGHNECVANMIQACAVSLYRGTYQLLAYVACMESSPTPHRVAKPCSSRVGVSWSALEHCASSRAGPRLLLKMGRKTASHRPTVPYVPFVVVNGKQDNDTQQRAASDFFGLVCSMLAEPVPRACVPGQSEVDRGASTGLVDLRGIGFTEAAFVEATANRTDERRTWKRTT
ncbi:hypothetical protein HPB50_019259 [Hyalomma asiaticum]|uniref:Uncharacterized protein n=1 Tax=Hyalomma asiaticum TaxID=266040 RepID=A0ACB7T3J2_HYAAI|nr:hypothetical protein HPB50_019259 [Hyalomma asiaticum]